MKLHNTLTKQVEPFTPLQPDQVTIYSCGPTVYDHIHIGNLRAFIAADTLRRTLTSSGLKVKHVMNFTDVDDKTIQRSQVVYAGEAPEVALQKLTRTYEDIFTKDMRIIGNDLQALTFVRATESIEAMQTLIKQLHEAGIAYVADDGVYFSISAYRKAGKTYGQLLKLDAHNTSEARIDNDEYDKESVHDFALWKTHKENEPAWEFELDGHNLLGRPGWHIECSVMSSHNVGQPFDIHTGGVDLIFPHHENEIAQSTAITKDPVYARYFVHNAHLLVDNRKMSKSLGNFFTLRDIQERGFAPLTFRMLVLQAHYRNQLNFTWESLEAARNRLQRWQSLAVLRFQTSEVSGDLSETLIASKQTALQVLQTDLDTPAALADLELAFEAIEKNGLSRKSEQAFIQLLQFIDTSLGLGLMQQTDVTAQAKELLQQRQAARDSKDWLTADNLRDALQAQGIDVRDTTYGQIWSYHKQ